ncbi:DUF4326 domain-containing protein [Candidatus Chloroploca asiatica]|uniref:DUF4326 domain-containing protein n=1 Tax=Candidatus Chloroploca asiatica TaxID=1506545 RepID=A0A2H3KLW3_9CHLR|nr:DUF4326 domain-containing protein [Candidatus Chloroploca asiatica]PDV98997.1 hypothetical protein A9Q02_14200 [Candidatus Chloroploca asiatica]
MGQHRRITVVHQRAITAQPGDHYIGRPSPLGNPFVIGRDGTRAEVIARYRTWLQTHVAAGPGNRVYDELQRLRARAHQHPLRLVCWCAPLPCHGDVIAEVLRDGMPGSK